MKTFYETPEMELIRFSPEDVITTSGEIVETSPVVDPPGGEWD